MEHRVMMLGWNAEMYDVCLARGLAVDVYDDNLSAVPSRAMVQGGWDFAAEEIAQAAPGCPKRIVIGVASSAAARSKAIQWLRTKVVQANYTPWPLHSPSAIISPFATLCNGTFVADGAYVGPGVRVESWACLLPGAKVCHDSVIGAGSIVVGNAMVLGRAHIGRHCWICAAATVLPEARIEDGMVVPYRGVMKRGVDVPPQ